MCQDGYMCLCEWFCRRGSYLGTSEIEKPSFFWLVITKRGYSKMGDVSPNFGPKSMGMFADLYFAYPFDPLYC